MTSTPDERSGSAACAEGHERLGRRVDELDAVLATARLGFCHLQGETGPLRANSQFQAEFGYPPDASPDLQALLRRVASEDRAALAEAVRAALRTGQDFDVRVRNCWPCGREEWIELRGRASESAQPRSLLLTCQNVSAAARRDAEHAAALDQQRSLRLAAEAANRGKDRFLSVLSHELRSPLNAILGWNRILAVKRPDDPEVAAATARIEHSARMQLKMANDLLDLGRIEAGKLRIEARPMQLARVAAAALDLARPAAAAKAITLSAHIEPGAGRLHGDPDRLQQVVSNLLSNAIKFTPSAGSIELTLRTVGSAAELSVQDSGQGIAAELLPHVFDRFRQGDDSSTRQAGGLGLGLALVREIVTLHGGVVTAASSGPGQGTRFVARFPTRQAWQAAPLGSAAADREPNHDTLSGLSILVVDDEADARTVVAETLKLEGARVTVTDSVGSALSKLQESGAHFDILVSDVGMPSEDGYSLVRRLRALESGRQLLAIAVTGYASKADVDAALDAGFDLHVPKPVDFNTFVPMVRRLAADRQDRGN